MAKDDLKPVVPFDQPPFTKGTVPSQDIGGPSDDKLADKAFAQQADYPGDRSPVDPAPDRK